MMGIDIVLSIATSIAVGLSTYSLYGSIKRAKRNIELEKLVKQQECCEKRIIEIKKKIEDQINKLEVIRNEINSDDEICEADRKELEELIDSIIDEHRKVK